eukprot:9879032-Ditylum_brightwellii.AAC.1
MNDAEQHGFIHKDLYSRRKGRTAADPVLITTLSRIIFHLQRTDSNNRNKCWHTGRCINNLCQNTATNGITHEYRKGSVNREK